jgi:hypothetical protein
MVQKASQGAHVATTQDSCQAKKRSIRQKKVNN